MGSLVLFGFLVAEFEAGAFYGAAAIAAAGAVCTLVSLMLVHLRQERRSGP